MALLLNVRYPTYHSPVLPLTPSQPYPQCRQHQSLTGSPCQYRCHLVCPGPPTSRPAPRLLKSTHLLPVCAGYIQHDQSSSANRRGRSSLHGPTRSANTSKLLQRFEERVAQNPHRTTQRREIERLLHTPDRQRLASTRLEERARWLWWTQR